MSNLTRFCWSRWETAVKAFDDNNLALAEEICLELVSEYRYPRFCQVQAYQMLSLCTQDWWLAKAEFEKGLELLRSLNDDNKIMVTEYREHTVGPSD